MRIADCGLRIADCGFARGDRTYFPPTPRFFWLAGLSRLGWLLNLMRSAVRRWLGPVPLLAPLLVPVRWLEAVGDNSLVVDVDVCTHWPISRGHGHALLTCYY